jgi:glycine cleavage system transcriptional repressor
MVNLRGQFAIMVLVAGATETLDRLRSEVWQLSQKSGLQAEVRPATSATGAASAEAMPYRLTATAIDQPGLVHRFSHLLRQMHVNIESLDTKLAPAPVTGTPLFEMEMVLSVPRSTLISKLREQLGQLGEEINIDWELKAE